MPPGTKQKPRPFGKRSAALCNCIITELSIGHATIPRAKYKAPVP